MLARIVLTGHFLAVAALPRRLDDNDEPEGVTQDASRTFAVIEDVRDVLVAAPSGTDHTAVSFARLLKETLTTKFHLPRKDYEDLVDPSNLLSLPEAREAEVWHRFRVADWLQNNNPDGTSDKFRLTVSPTDPASNQFEGQYNISVELVSGSGSESYELEVKKLVEH